MGCPGPLAVIGHWSDLTRPSAEGRVGTAHLFDLNATRLGLTIFETPDSPGSPQVRDATNMVQVAMRYTACQPWPQRAIRSICPRARRFA